VTRMGDARVAARPCRRVRGGAEHLADLPQGEDHHQPEEGADRDAEDRRAEQVEAEEVNDEGGEDQQAISGGDVVGVAVVEAGGEDVDAIGQRNFDGNFGNALAEQGLCREPDDDAEDHEGEADADDRPGGDGEGEDACDEGHEFNLGRGSGALSFGGAAKRGLMPSMVRSRASMAVMSGSFSPRASRPVLTSMGSPTMNLCVNGAVDGYLAGEVFLEALDCLDNAGLRRCAPPSPPPVAT